MKNKKLLLGALLLLSTLTACRQDSDNLYNYAHNDAVIYTGSKSNFAEKFKILWHGLDQNYPIFDYEEKFGVNWDDVYNEYLPQFEALDKRENVTDEELKELLTKVVAPLHDGHMNILMKNHQTGENVSVSPGEIRNKSRKDFESSESFVPDLSTYLLTDLKEYTTASTRFDDYWSYLLNEKGIGMDWLNTRIQELETSIATSSMTATTDPMDVEKLGKYQELKKVMNQMEASTVNTQMMIKNYNKMVEEVSFLNVPGLDIYDADLNEMSTKVSFALTKENIAYLSLTDFSLTPALDRSQRKDLADVSKTTLKLLDQVAMVWQRWFDAIQYHHKAGDLKGVIIDLRSNNGGMINDFQYLLGALMPSGRYTSGYSRYKRGTSRFEYSVVMPHDMMTMTEEHVTVNEPIVVLTNCRSVSMAEITTMSVKKLPNGKQIGTCTWGGLGGLSDASTYSFNYSGHIGIQGETDVYGYVPQMTYLNDEGEILEGVGAQPDIECDFDEVLNLSTGRDTQYERAIDYIINGK